MESFVRIFVLGVFGILLSPVVSHARQEGRNSTRRLIGGYVYPGWKPEYARKSEKSTSQGARGQQPSKQVAPRVQKTSQQARPRVTSNDAGVDVVGLLVKDEEDILPYWLAWHSAIFGVDNIVIVDQMCSAPASSILRDFESKGGTVMWRVQDYSRKGEHIMAGLKLMQSKKHVRFFFPLDVDEFIVAAQTVDSTGKDINDYRLRPGDVTTEITRLFLAAECGKKKCPTFSYFPRFIRSTIHFVNETVETVSNFCVRTTDISLGMSSPDMQKKFFFAEDLMGLDHGSHHGQLRPGSKNNVQPVESLRLLHYHLRNPAVAAKKATNDVYGFGYNKNHDGSPVPDELLDAHLMTLVHEMVPGYHKVALFVAYRSSGLAAFVGVCGEEGSTTFPTLPQLVRDLPQFTSAPQTPFITSQVKRFLADTDVGARGRTPEGAR